MSMRSEWFLPLMARIIRNPSLDSDDRPWVKKLIDSLNVAKRKDFEQIDDMWEHQMKMEAIMVYLLGKYGDQYEDADDLLGEIESTFKVDIPIKDPESGYKRTKDDIDSILLQNEEVREAREAKRSNKSLNNDMQYLSKLVFGRNQKLENLTVNYRRMIAADEHGG